MADSTNTAPVTTKEDALSSYIGTMMGAFQDSRFKQAYAIIDKYHLDDGFYKTAQGVVTGKMALAAVFVGGVTNGASGASNASFATAIAIMAGPVAGGAYGYLLDTISSYVEQNNWGGEIYDFQAQVEKIASDPEFWDAYKANLEGFAFWASTPFRDIGHWIGQNAPTPYDINKSVSDLFEGAHRWFQRRDPLTLDLDGDGLETVGIDTGNNWGQSKITAFGQSGAEGLG